MIQTIESRNRNSVATERPAGERRRPGRRDYENPALVALLRQNQHLDTAAFDGAREDTVATGIIVAVVIAVLTLGTIVLLAAIS
jgi:hypothetical protein